MAKPSEENLLNTAEFDLETLLSAIPLELLEDNKSAIGDETTSVENYKCEECRFHATDSKSLIVHMESGKPKQ